MSKGKPQLNKEQHLDLEQHHLPINIQENKQMSVKKTLSTKLNQHFYITESLNCDIWLTSFWASIHIYRVV